MSRGAVGARLELSVVSFLWLRADCRINNDIIRLQDSNTVPAHMSTNLWQPGISGNPAGRLRGSRNKLSEAVICALLRDFSRHGEKAIAKVRREQPGVWLKVIAMLIRHEQKLEHSNPLKDLTDEQLEAMIEYIETSLAAHAAGPVKVIEATAQPALELPKPKNRLMLEAATAVGPRERKPRKVPSPART
jgi:hypothetical protein